MRNIMTSIFKENNFKIIDPLLMDSIDSFYAISKNDKKVNYYLVLFVDSLFDSNEEYINFNNLYEKLIKLEEYRDQQMDKNLSMVICAKRENLINNEVISQEIYKIEEDPYFFKKYVLTYTEHQVNSIHNQVSREEIMDFIYNILNNHDAFISFKSSPYEETDYNLIAKIFIKLPFLTLNNSIKTMDDLSKNISNSLEEQQIKLRDKALEYASIMDETEIRDKILSFIGGDKDE